MSEPVLQAAEALAAPLFKDAVAALTPEAAKVLADVKAKLAAEADQLRAELPAKAEEAAQHVHDIASAVLGRYQTVMEWIDAKVAGAATADPTPAAPAPQTTQS